VRAIDPLARGCAEKVSRHAGTGSSGHAELHGRRGCQLSSCRTIAGSNRNTRAGSDQGPETTWFSGRRPRQHIELSGRGVRTGRPVREGRISLPRDTGDGPPAAQGGVVSLRRVAVRPRSQLTQEAEIRRGRATATRVPELPPAEGNER